MKIIENLPMSDAGQQAPSNVTCRCLSLDIQPLTLRVANAFVLKFHS